jgi:hypothetical protein
MSSEKPARRRYIVAVGRRVAGFHGETHELPDIYYLMESNIWRFTYGFCVLIQLYSSDPPASGYPLIP